MNILKHYGYFWVTLAIFVLSLVGHWFFGWSAYVKEQFDFSLPVDFGDYSVEMLRDTLENWQSEFLQLIWQVAGLSFLWYLGSPQSKEGSDRAEEKIDALLKLIDKEKGEKIVKDLNTLYPKK